MSESLLLMQDDITRDAQMLRAKRTILKILKGLPDEASRRNVIVAAAALHGLVESVKLREP